MGWRDAGGFDRELPGQRKFIEIESDSVFYAIPLA
jgi:hypothetical protein